MNMFKQIKKALIEKAAGLEPPDGYVEQDNVIDLSLGRYLSLREEQPHNKSEIALEAQVLTKLLSLCREGAKTLTREEMDVTIDGAIVRYYALQASRPSRPPAGPGPF